MSAAADSLLELTGDPVAAAWLRRELRERAAETAGTELGDKIAAVLDGRLHVRALATDPDFALHAERTRLAFDDYWAGLDADQRQAAQRKGEEALGELEPDDG
ncbi:hypothetical protein [Nocardioides bigeumensis]|uniref:Uncharacterized protein n=1 Tax=Nocardioides bigeumensis TaxID=433657 RepID=A0ABN2XPJ7_9ACTN